MKSYGLLTSVVILALCTGTIWAVGEGVHPSPTSPERVGSLELGVTEQVSVAPVALRAADQQSVRPPRVQRRGSSASLRTEGLRPTAASPDREVGSVRLGDETGAFTVVGPEGVAPVGVEPPVIHSDPRALRAASLSVSATDMTPTAPLSNPTPSGFQPRYISGFGNGDSFTVFFEDRDNANTISYVSTTTGPTGFPASVTATDISDTHFCVKDWPINIGGTDYDYRAWASVGNNLDHHFYVSNNLANWTLVNTFTITVGVYSGSSRSPVYYGFHDVVLLNGTYYAWGESNQGQTVICKSALGDDVWETIGSVGGTLAGDGPLQMPESGTPSGSFFDLGFDRGYGKIMIRGNDSGFYLAINTAAKPSLAAAALETAFIDPSNWTWVDGTTGLPGSAFLAETAEHDVREGWLVPGATGATTWNVIYDADFGAGDGGKALGYATMTVPPPPPTEAWVDDDYCDICGNDGHTWGYDAFDNIQDAIDAVEGSTVYVAAGTYVENLTIDKRLTLRGAGSANTIIDASGGAFGILISAGGLSAVQRLTIEDLKITGATQNGIRAYKAGGFDFHFITLDGVVIAGSASNGLEMHNGTDVSDLEVLNCDFSSNGGVGLRTSSATPLDGLLIDNSHFDNGTYGVYLTKETVNVTIRNSTMNGNSQRGYWGSNGRVSNLLIQGCQANSNLQRGITVWSYDPVNGIDGATICQTSMNNNGFRGFHIGAATDYSETVATTVANVLLELCSLTGNGDMGFHVDLGLLSNVGIHNSDLSGNVNLGVKHINLPISSGTVAAEDNWWGDASGPTHASNPSGTGIAVSDNVDFDPWGSTANTHLAAGGARLVDTQNPDGGWGWPLTGGSAQNTIAPIGMGLARAYQETGDADMYAALLQVSSFLLAKTYFSGQDGYLAAELDRLLGGTAHVDHLNTNFYDMLAAGTYLRGSAPVGPYNTTTYVAWVRANRSGSQANMAGWDMGLGLVAAASCGVSGTELDIWIDGVKGEIDELDPATGYEPIGLAGAVYGLAFVGEDYTAGGGGWADGKDLGELADLLVTLQIPETGGIAWDVNWVIAYDGNESIQSTAYAVLALLEVGGYSSEVLAAVAYIERTQLCTGGWKNYISSSSENNEVTAEALRAIGLPVKNLDTGELFATIQGAIDDADTVAGDTVEIQTAVHSEGQVVVDKDLSLQGGSVDTIKMTVDTGSSGDARAWFLVNPDVTLDVSDLIFDGNGHLIWQAFRHKGNGSFTNCTFHDIKFNESGPHYSGVAIAAFGGVGNPVDVTDCTFEEIGRVGLLYFGTGVSGSVYSGNTYTGKGSGDWLDYALDISAGAVITVSDSTQTECRGIASSDGSTSAGILITTYYGGGTAATVTGCTITHNTTGIAVGYDLSDTSTVDANNNAIYDNGLTTGIHTTSSVMVDATNNWWGDASGPYDEDSDGSETVELGACTGDPASEKNADGTGDIISDTSTEVVDYCPWLTEFPRVTLEPDAACYGNGDTVTVGIWMRDVTETIVGGQFFLGYDDARLQFVSMGPGDAPFTEEISANHPGDDGAGTIDYGVGVLGADPGTSADTKMVTLTFTALTQICTETDLITWRSHQPPSRLSNDMGGEVLPLFVDMDVIDDEAPAFAEAAGDLDITVQCDESTDPANTGTPTPSDNCDMAAVDPLVYADVSDLAGCNGTGTITRTWTATDECGNVSTYVQTITVADTTDPTFAEVPAALDTTIECDESTDPANTGTPTPSDNCGMAAVDPLTYADVPDLAGCNGTGTITRTWTATDKCGNTSAYVQVITVEDTTLPVLSSCPTDIDVPADAGGCDAEVTYAPPTATDNCDAAPTVTCDWPSGSVFPTGTTLVTCTAEDACGNSSQCTFNVTVNGVNEMVVDVQLAGVVDPGPFTRCITFEFWECGPDSSVVVEETLTFVNGLASATVEVACGAYNCLTARDELHALRRTDVDDFTISGTQYVADFTDLSGSGGDDDSLVGGNFNDDLWIDVLDFGVFTWQWAVNYGSGDTTCATTYPHADVNGDGLVDNLEFSFIQVNFWEQHEANCCGTGGAVASGSGPMESISIRELSRRGLGHLAIADLNGDGVLDLTDIAAFAQGARPDVRPKTSRLDGNSVRGR